MSKLETLAARLLRAENYFDIFPDADTITEVYRKLARVAHPDGYTNGGDYSMAANAFTRLTNLKREAEQMVTEGRFGEPVILATIRTRKHTHQVRSRIGEDEMAVYYSATTDGATETMVKVARSAKDNDLMAQEATALKTLHATEDPLTRHFPVLHDSFLHSEGRRRANVTPLYTSFHSLATVRGAYPSGLDPRHGAWMFRRLLMALGYAHDHGLVHGAVTPDNVLIEASDHAVVLIDWCYSVVIDDESKTNVIKAVVPMYKPLYAPEVFAKEAPSPATDLYMAATLMSYLMPDMPRPFRAFFKGVALTSQAMRPQNAWLLLEEFDELLKTIGEPFHPRRFVKFAVPSGVA